jgi:uncharacterized protein
MAEARIGVEVAYARSDVQRIYTLELPASATVRDAIEQCAVLREFPEIDLHRHKVGIFGKVTKLDQVLRAGDRVEIYRPLIADPKQARKQRAAQGLKMKKKR